MKKAVLSAVICAAVTFTASLTAMAGTSNISVKNNSPQSKPISYSYNNESGTESAKSIKSLMTKLEELDRLDSVVQTLTVTSESDGGVPVSVKLRLSLPGAKKDDGPESPENTDNEILDYYNIKVTSADGTVLYNDADVTETDENAAYKDIDLGLMNVTSSAENKIFNVTLSVNKDMKDLSKSKTEARRIDWSIVTAVAEAQPTPEPGNTDNENETDENADSADKQADGESTAPPAQTTASPTSAPTVNQSANEITLPSGNYIIGQEIPAGRYTITGSGKVHVYGEDGILRMTVALKRKGDASTNGVDEYVLTVKDGETVNIENEIMLSPFRSSVILPTAKPSASPSATPNSGTNSTSAPKSTSSQNPKTGDTTPVVLISVIGAAALLSAAAIAVIKRKINK